MSSGDVKYRFAISAPSMLAEEIRTQLAASDPTIELCTTRVRHGVVDSLIAAAPVLLEVSANSLECIEYLRAYLHTRPRRAAAEVEIVVGESKFSLATSDTSIVYRLHGLQYRQIRT